MKNPRHMEKALKKILGSLPQTFEVGDDWNSIVFPTGHSKPSETAFNEALAEVMEDVDDELPKTELVGDLHVGTSNLVVDISTSNVGIGTSTPGFKLDVHGNANVGALTATTVAATTFTGSMSTSLLAGNYLTGTSYNGSTARTFAVDGTTSATASKVVVRDASGDILCRLVRPNYTDQTTISGAMAYRVSTTDNYIRFCSDKGAIRTFLELDKVKQINGYTEVDINSPDDVSGTWTTTTSSSWGDPKFNTTYDKYRWNDAPGHVQYNIPTGMKSAYISQLQWSTGGYVDVHGIQSDGGLVFLRRINTRQAVENTNEGNPDQHDGQTITFIGSGLDTFTAIRLTNKVGRFHMDGLAFTPNPNEGTEGTGMVHSGQISDLGSGIPTPTGTGASGTWGISITGNAGTSSSCSGNSATATKLATARAINGVNFDGSAAISVNGLNYNVNDSWFRENGDNAHVRMYGNSRQMVFRTDGTTEYASGVGGYPFAWMYGGDAAGNRRMLLNTDGQLWCSNYGWLHDCFAYKGGSSGQNFSTYAVYPYEWIRIMNTNSGIYWEESTSVGWQWHIYPKSRSDMYLRTGSGNGGIAGTVENATVRGYIHWTTSNEIGFLNSAREWTLRCDNSKNVQVYGTVTANGFSGTATNSTNLGGVGSGSYLRSDTNTTMWGGSAISFQATNSPGLKFQNASWYTSLWIGGWSSDNSNDISRIRNSSGNLHIDSAANGSLYLNWYTSGSIEINSTVNSSGYINANNGATIRRLVPYSYSYAAGYNTAAIEVREYGLECAAGGTEWARAPRIGFHWCGRVASQILCESNGRISVVNNPGNAYEAFGCSSLYSSYRIGVQTSNPFCPLHVFGTGGDLASGGWRYLSVGGSGSGSGDQWGAVCASFEGGIIRTTDAFLAHNGYLASSDHRIKKEILDINDASALEKLRLIEPKTYKYKDEQKMGADVVYGFIAQQIQEVLPYATNTVVDYIPSICEMANVSQSNVITFINFNTSTISSNVTTIQVHPRKGPSKDVTISEIINEHSIRVNEDLTEMLQEGDARLFVYGELVSDFVTIKKDAIWTIATAALQEVDRQQQADKVRIAELEAQLASVLARLNALENPPS